MPTLASEIFWVISSIAFNVVIDSPIVDVFLCHSKLVDTFELVTYPFWRPGITLEGCKFSYLLELALGVFRAHHVCKVIVSLLFAKFLHELAHCISGSRISTRAIFTMLDNHYGRLFFCSLLLLFGMSRSQCIYRAFRFGFLKRWLVQAKFRFKNKLPCLLCLHWLPRRIKCVLSIVAELVGISTTIVLRKALTRLTESQMESSAVSAVW